MLNRARDCLDIPGLNNDSFYAVPHHVTRLSRRNHRQSARGRFVNCFRAAFQTRRENVNRSLIEIVLGVALETENANVLTAEFFQMRLRLFMDTAEEPELGVAQIQPMPRFEQMVDSLALDQRTRENRPKNWRLLPPVRLGPWFETIDIDAARQVEQFFIRKIRRPKRLGCFFREHDNKRGEIVLLQKSLR